MSVHVAITWHCLACEKAHNDHIRKPSVLSPTILSKLCDGCRSRFVIKFAKVPAKQEIRYGFIRSEISEAGMLKAKLIKEMKDIKPAIPPVETKGQEHDNNGI